MRWITAPAGFVALLALAPACRRTHVPPTVSAPVQAQAEPEVAYNEPPPLAPVPVPVPAPVPVAVPVPVGGAPLAVGGGDGGTVNGDPNGPRAEALNAVLIAAQPSLQGCLDGAVPAGVDVEVRLSYRIVPSGRTVGVEVSAPGAPREAEECLRRVADDLRFPPFQGEAVGGSFPYRYRRGR